LKYLVCQRDFFPQLYRWPPVWLVWNQLYDYHRHLFKIDCLSFVVCLLLVPLLGSLYFLDVYEWGYDTQLNNKNSTLSISFHYAECQWRPLYNFTWSNTLAYYPPQPAAKERLITSTPVWTPSMAAPALIAPPMAPTGPPARLPPTAPPMTAIVLLAEK